MNQTVIKPEEEEEEKTDMHPYGCEAETSLQELFDFFTRCLQNGEWELAEACVPQLCDAGGEVSQRLRDIIKAVITYPYLLE